MRTATPMFESNCPNCNNRKQFFVIPAEGSTEVLLPPCECGHFTKVEKIHPENANNNLLSWYWAIKKGLK